MVSYSSQHSSTHELLNVDPGHHNAKSRSGSLNLRADLSGCQDSRKLDYLRLLPLHLDHCRHI